MPAYPLDPFATDGPCHSHGTSDSQIVHVLPCEECMLPGSLTNLSQLFDLDPMQQKVLRHHRMKQDDLGRNKYLSTCPPSLTSGTFEYAFIELSKRPFWVSYNIRVCTCTRRWWCRSWWALRKNSFE